MIKFGPFHAVHLMWLNEKTGWRLLQDNVSRAHILTMWAHVRPLAVANVFSTCHIGCSKVAVDLPMRLLTLWTTQLH